MQICGCGWTANAPPPRRPHPQKPNFPSLSAEEGVGLEVAFLVEVSEGFGGGAEDLGGGLGDEGGGFLGGFPDDEGIAAVVMGVLEFAFDAGGEGGFAGGLSRRTTADGGVGTTGGGGGDFGDVADDHIGLADEEEVAGVDLAVDVGEDGEDVGDFELESVFAPPHF